MNKIRQGILTVLSNKRIDRDHFMITFDDDNFDFKPGQFIMVDVISQRIKQNVLKFGYPLNPLLMRPFSIYLTSNDGDFSILCKIKENGGTEYLSSLISGDKVAFKGPLGSPIGILGWEDKIITLIAGGVGIAPITFLAQALIHSGYRVKLYFGVRELGDFLDFCIENLYSVGVESKDIWIVYESLGELGKLLLIDIQGGTYRGIPCFQGNMITALNACWLCQIQAAEGNIYVCAPEKVMKYVHDSCSCGMGKNVYVFMEEYLGCGVGVCGGCNINGYKLCQKGPIFNSKDINWESRRQ